MDDTTAPRPTSSRIASSRITGPHTSGPHTSEPRAGAGPVTPTRTLRGAVTSVSWIPSEAVPGLQARVFDTLGLLHYDAPPPDRLDDLDRWRDEDRFRFANALRARVEVVDTASGPRVVSARYESGSRIGSTTLRLGRHHVTFAAVARPELQSPPEVHADRVRFVQTFGGRTAVPGPRRVAHAPWFQLQAPLVWTTLALTIHLDGRVTHEVVGASRFPRHWVYGDDGELTDKVGVADFTDWYRHSFGRHTPWGDEESPALVTAAESVLERTLSRAVMDGGGPAAVREYQPGSVLVDQGDPGDEVLLLLDGVVTVEVDGRTVAEAGPGAILGERAGLEGGTRTAALRSRTRCRVAVVPTGRLEDRALSELSRSHRREQALAPR